MKEVLRTSEPSVLTGATRLNIPEDAILHSHRRGGLKSYSGKDVSLMSRSSFTTGRRLLFQFHFICNLYQYIQQILQLLQCHVEDCSVALFCNICAKPVVAYGNETYKPNLKDYNYK
jgi:hypothetical protein